LQRLLTQLRDHSVMPVPGGETERDARSCIEDDFQHDLLQERCLAPTTVHAYLDTVRRFLRDRVSAQPLRLEALCAQDVTGFIVQQARRYSPAHAT
jgi:hypothetical protein